VARVMQGDLAMVASRLKDMTTVDQRWLGFYTFALPHREESQLTLARAPSLSAEDWEMVSQSALELYHFEEGLRQTVSPGGPNPGALELSMSSPEKQRGLRTMWENATTAYNVLAEMAATKPVSELLHAET